LLLNRTYNRIEELFEDYARGALHPDDAKPALAKAVNQILQVNPSPPLSPAVW
jgi:tyrosyl-tRNA synthetase